MTDIDALIAEADRFVEDTSGEFYENQLVHELVTELRQERERAETYREGVRIFGEKIRDMGIEEFEQSKDLARAREVIETIRSAVGDVTEQWKPLVIADVLAAYDQQS